MTQTMTTNAQIVKDERLLWAYLSVMAGSIPGQYLFLAGANVVSTEVALSLCARFGQVVVLAAVLYLTGEHEQRYARMRTSVCAV